MSELIRTYRHPWIGHRSYLITDQVSGTAAVVDPVHDGDPYLEDAFSAGCTLRHVLLTQIHPDFETGHLELSERTGAEIYVGAWARPEYAAIPLKDGDVLEFGDVRLKILETPGHALEAISILVYDLRRSDRQPEAVLTGDTLRIGDVGRPDPFAIDPLTCRELSAMLYRSLWGKLLRLPEATRVYPADEGAPEVPWSTIGQERRTNFALRPMSHSVFTRLVCSEVLRSAVSAPAVPRLNAVRRYPWPKEGPADFRPFSLQEFLRRQRGGLQALDVRDPADYAAAHLERSLNLGLGGPFADWVGPLLDPERPVGIIAEPGREGEAVVALRAAGVESPGFLQRAMEALEAHPELIRRTPRVTVGELARELASDRPPRILDVRTSEERAGGRIEGSVHVPLGLLRKRRDEIDTGDVVVVCSSGYRASAAAGLLERAGSDRVRTLIGGMAAWEIAR